jgi:homoserine kinase type II
LTKKDELKRVLNFYNLGELERAFRVEQGVVNENWIVETIQGRYFFKKRHPELRNADLIRAQHGLIKHLRRSGFPTPDIIPTRRNETLLILDGEFYEIQELIVGKPYQQNNSAHLIAAANALGFYHAHVQSFMSQDLCSVGRLYCPTVLTSNLLFLSEDSELCQGPVVDLVEALASHAADLSSRLSSFKQLPHLVIHGDYHAGNLIFKNDCIVGLVDFDKARYQPRIVELAEALIYFASPINGEMEHLAYSGVLEWDRFAGFLKHYANALRSPDKNVLRYISALQPASDILVRTQVESAWLCEDEVCALPDYIRAIWLCVSIEQMIKKRSQTFEIKEFLRELLALSDWPLIHRQSLIEVGHAAMSKSKSNNAGLSFF